MTSDHEHNISQFFETRSVGAVLLTASEFLYVEEQYEWSPSRNACWWFVDEHGLCHSRVVADGAIREMPIDFSEDEKEFEEKAVGLSPEARRRLARQMASEVVARKRFRTISREWKPMLDVDEEVPSADLRRELEIIFGMNMSVVDRRISGPWISVAARRFKQSLFANSHGFWPVALTGLVERLFDAAGINQIPARVLDCTTGEIQFDCGDLNRDD